MADGDYRHSDDRRKHEEGVTVVQNICQRCHAARSIVLDTPASVTLKIRRPIADL